MLRTFAVLPGKVSTYFFILNTQRSEYTTSYSSHLRQEIKGNSIEGEGTWVIAECKSTRSFLWTLWLGDKYIETMHVFLKPRLSHRYALFSAFIFRSDLHHPVAYSALTSIIKHHRHQQWLQKCLIFPLLMLFVPALLAPSFSQRTALTVVIEESSSLNGTSLLCERRHDISLLLGLVCFVSVASLIHPFYDAHLVSALQLPILMLCTLQYTQQYLHHLKAQTSANLFHDVF